MFLLAASACVNQGVDGAPENDPRLFAVGAFRDFFLQGADDDRGAVAFRNVVVGERSGVSSVTSIRSLYSTHDIFKTTVPTRIPNDSSSCPVSFFFPLALPSSSSTGLPILCVMFCGVWFAEEMPAHLQYVTNLSEI